MHVLKPNLINFHDQDHFIGNKTNIKLSYKCVKQLFRYRYLCLLPDKK